ncbi:MAG: hypothetical protein ACOC2W_00220 [bacterium]
MTFYEKAQRLALLNSHCKDYQFMNLANFCWIGCLYYVQKNNWENINLYIETDDPNGVIEGQVYYDLFKLEIGGISTCIPMPLIRNNMIVARLYKKATIVDREIHLRKTITGQNYDKYNLARMIIIVVGEDMNNICQFGQYILGSEIFNDCKEDVCVLK